MKKTLAAVAISASLIGSTVQAGSLADPILEEDLIVAETTSDGGILVPILFLILAIPAITN